MSKTQVKLDKKERDWLFACFDNVFIEKGVHWVPSFLQTNHLTLLSILWSLLAIGFGYLSMFNVQWLWGLSLAIVLHYITDMLDGAVGRHRNTGLVKWGYYMDHFLDYIFMSAVFGSYLFLVNGFYIYLLLALFVLLTGFMIHTLLHFSVTNDFKISYYKIGPTELRYLAIIINIFTICYGIQALKYVLFFLIVISGILLVMTVYNTHRLFWKMDMEIKNSGNR